MLLKERVCVSLAGGHKDGLGQDMGGEWAGIWVFRFGETDCGLLMVSLLAET